MVLSTILPLPYNGTGVSYTCGSILSAMTDNGLRCQVFTPVARRQIGHGVEIHQALPPLRRLLPYRYNAPSAQEKLERLVFRTLAGATEHARGVYLWPDISLDLIEELKRRGYLLIREMINTHRGFAKKILDEAYRELGSPPLHTISASSVEHETQVLSRMDYVFCPNSMVAQSLQEENGFQESQLLRTSYGWEPARILSSQKSLPEIDGVTVLFVGRVCVRKGAHILLDLWARSGIKGRLVLAGGLEPFIAERFRSCLSREDVVVLDYVKDVGALYRSADIFAFPTLEEGGPMVTFEAQGAGLPALTTPMGRAGIVEDGVTGFVRDPHDHAGMLSALHELAASVELRVKMGEAARMAARYFSWTEVGRRRSQQLRRILIHNPA
jgi:glycosyltransferase involved in cell wall biosynthesis